MAHPVFYDPRRARWKRLRTLFDVAGIIVGTVVIVFIYAALRSEPLQKPLLEFQKHPYHALKETEKEKAIERRKQLVRRSHRRTGMAPSQVELNTDEGIRGAFYVPWDAASFSSLREYARQIDLLYPEWLHVLTPDGRLQSVDEQTAKLFDVVQNGVVHPVDDMCMALVTRKYPSPLISRLLPTPVAWLEPCVRSRAVPATLTPRPTCWGPVPPVAPGRVRRSVTRS